MESETGGKSNGYSIQWKIENISHCWLENGQNISSPSFVADALQGTKWHLLLLLKGYVDESKVNFYLVRESNCTGPSHVRVHTRLTFLDKDGLPTDMIPGMEENFMKGAKSVEASRPRETLFFTERGTFISEDTLTVQCDIWKIGETPVKLQLLSAQTVLKVNRRSFLWKINEFSTLKPGARTKFKDDLIDFDLVLNEGLNFERKLVINGILFDERTKYFSFKTCIINSVGRKEDCGTHEYFVRDLKKKGVLSTLLSVKKLTENKPRYLPNDVLTLECECVYSDGTVLYEVCGNGIIYPKVANATTEKGNEQSGIKDNSENTSTLSIDMKSMYDDGIFSDTALRTSTQTFPVHKNILSARSPVFRKMFSHDMKEKHSGHVDITDLNEDSVNRMLLYIYTDILEDLTLENACKLYVAADKYEILSLKNKCSSFLKKKLCPDKACDILVVADLHHDDDLKSAVQDYILRHDQEVFGSLEWKHFMDANPKLAANVMFKKVFPH